MNRDYIENTLGCTREEDAAGNYFYDYNGGFFVKSETYPDKYYFIYHDNVNIENGAYAQGIIESKELFEKLYR